MTDPTTEPVTGPTPGIPQGAGVPTSPADGRAAGPHDRPVPAGPVNGSSAPSGDAGDVPPAEADRAAAPAAAPAGPGPDPVAAPVTTLDPDATDPTDPTDAADQVDAADPADAADPTDPTDPAGPVADAGADEAPLFAPYPEAVGVGTFAAYPGDGAAPVNLPPEAVVRPDGTTVCPACDHPIEKWSSFCEVCGQTLTPTAPMPKAPVPPVPAEPAPALHPCAECGGPIGADLYCQQCGAKAPTARDHFREAPASWVAGVCDRGIRHHRNEDALALAADDEPGSRAVLIVCDGVSNAEDSHIASLAAARAARGVLTSARPDVDEDRTAVYLAALAEAAREANAAVVERTPDDSVNPPSSTFAAAVVDHGLIVHGNVGDSRVYWIDDRPDHSRQLSTDDSVAQARMAMGVDRETAENGPQAHAITRWLGRDTPDLVPTSGSLAVPGNGWVLVCTDGLWNYASTAEELADLVREAINRNPGNQRVRSLAVSLVRWARQQGGKDNVTVALARVGEFAPAAGDPAATVLTEVPPPDAATADQPGAAPAPVPAEAADGPAGSVSGPNAEPDHSGGETEGGSAHRG